MSARHGDAIYIGSKRARAEIPHQEPQQPQREQLPERLTRNDLSPFLRATAVSKIFHLLTEDDRALAREGRPKDIDFSRYSGRESGKVRKQACGNGLARSPLITAHDELELEYGALESGDPMAYKLKKSSATKVLRTWFNRMFEMPSRGELSDRPRGRVAGEALLESDWEFLKKCLVEFHFRDTAGNLRRMGTLHKCWERLQRDSASGGESAAAAGGESDAAVAKHRFDQLERIKAASGVKGWDRLHKLVVQKFDLKTQKESFKPQRSRRKAMHDARRRRGEDPRYEYYREAKGNIQNAARCKILKGVPLLDDEVRQVTGGDFGAVYSIYLEDWHHELTGSLDGFKIANAVSGGSLSRKVCRYVPRTLSVDERANLKRTVQRVMHMPTLAPCV